MDKQIIEWITRKPEVSCQISIVSIRIMLLDYSIGELIIMLMCTHGVKANGISLVILQILLVYQLRLVVSMKLSR